uniref:Uncharacterized protein n=1 Tax=Micrurus surinamensis TaxID=129470 RepID=A0A2D4NR76_MICSU
MKKGTCIWPICLGWYKDSCLGQEVGVVARQLPAELAADLDGEEVGEVLGPVLESGENSDGCSASEAETGAGPSDISQLPSESEISGEEEQLEPVPDVRMCRAVRRGEQLRNRG